MNNGFVSLVMYMQHYNDLSLFHSPPCRLDRIIVPVHEGSHWTAAMVDLANKRFVFFDSFHGHNRAALAALRRWLADEAKVR